MSLDGDNWKDVTRCQPREPVSVLQIHGDADTVISYKGGAQFAMAAYPSAQASAGGWAAKNGCAPMPDTSAPPVDVSADIAGPESTIQRYTGCMGGAAELWTVKGGPHQPNLATDFGELIWSFLAAHPKP